MDYIIVIPLAELEKWLPKMWKTSRHERWYWHVVVREIKGPKLSLTKPLSPIDLSSFVLK